MNPSLSDSIHIRPFEDSDEDAVIALWDRCGLLRSWNDPHKDIARKKLIQRELFLVGLVGQEIVAATMAGYDGHRGWVYYFGVDPAYQRNGYGRALMAKVERRLRELGCPKINLQVRQGNDGAIAFYQSVGFEQQDLVQCGKRLEEDG
jgi:ribosomal protein S18 acetylase RimI-like enzyme